MNRRGFLGSILALGAAPAIVKAEILMPVRKIVVVDRAAEFEVAIRRKLAEVKADMERQLMGNELADIIWDVAPWKTPTGISNLVGRNIKHEWIITDLVGR